MKTLLIATALLVSTIAPAYAYIYGNGESIRETSDSVVVVNTVR